MAGGVVAAFSGPNLARLTIDLFPDASFAACFLGLIALHSVTILLLLRIDIPPPPAGENRAATTPLPELLRRPALLIAIAAGVAGYASMNLVMTATPLAMVGHDFTFGHAAMVIQWHVFAMFAPSFFTGHIIARIGVLNVIIAGAACILVCVAINLNGASLVHYLVALIALGLGWNFMFVGATALLTTTHDVADRAKVQGFNEFMIFGSVSLASFASGAVQQELGWFATNLMVLPVVLAALAATAWLRLSAMPAAGSTSGGK
jgi:predicted MFS family arabinose efflux permease